MCHALTGHFERENVANQKTAFILRITLFPWRRGSAHEVKGDLSKGNASR